MMLMIFLMNGKHDVAKWLIYGVRWGGVFVLGFSIGYALIVALVPETPTDENAAQQVTGQSYAGVTMGELTSIPVEQVALAVPSHVVQSAGQQQPAMAATGTALQGQAFIPAGEPPGLKTEQVIPAGDGTVAMQAPWWERCRNQKCRVEFGDIEGGLLIRKGALEHGVTLDWQKTFAGAPRVDVLPTVPGIELELRAVAMDVHGKPAAAEIIWNQGEKRIAGVIALDLGAMSKQVVMVP
jgi:hypothetical protein